MEFPTSFSHSHLISLLQSPRDVPLVLDYRLGEDVASLYDWRDGKIVLPISTEEEETLRSLLPKFDVREGEFSTEVRSERCPCSPDGVVQMEEIEWEPIRASTHEFRLEIRGENIESYETSNLMELRDELIDLGTPDDTDEIQVDSDQHLGTHCSFTATTTVWVLVPK